MLHDVVLVVLFALAGGAAFRARGSSLVHQFQAIPMEGRIIWSLVAGGLCASVTHDWWMLATIPAWFIGCIPGWFNTLDLGRDYADWETAGMSRFRVWAEEAAWMAFRGILWTLPAGVVAAVLGTPWPWSAVLALSGIVCPLLYEAAWRIPIRIKHLTQGPEVGEALFGAWIGAMIAVTLG